MIVIGIDCSTEFKKVGLALGEFSELSHHRLLGVDRVNSRKSIIERLVSWIPRDGGCLLAIDAPLGWPAPLGSVLSSHRAGQVVSIESNQLFRRETDRFVKKMIGKQPLDVGADRIARTAHAALRLLDEIRCAAKLELPLAWSRDIDCPSAIEVYPAATLLAHGLRSAQYKQKTQGEVRKEIAGGLSRLMSIEETETIAERLIESDDVLDAAVCVLAGCDFLSGNAVVPKDRDLAVKEGWIWVKSPSG